MNAKWYIGTLMILLALVGLNQEQTKVANQQIVLQFTGVEATAVSANDDVVGTVTRKLEALGAANIEVIENEGKQLSIRYYSAIDAFHIGEFLSQDIEPSFAHTTIDGLPEDFPNDKLPESCSLIVLDIQQHADDAFHLNGNFSTELSHDYEQYSKLVVFPLNTIRAHEQNAFVREAFKINKRVAAEINSTSYAIPQVRAGPHLYEES